MTPTPNLGLSITTEGDGDYIKFLEWRQTQDGTSGSSNMGKIDSWAGDINDWIDDSDLWMDTVGNTVSQIGGSLVNISASVVDVIGGRNLQTGSGIGKIVSGSTITLYGNFSAGCGITFDVDNASNNVSIRTSASRITVHDGGTYKQMWMPRWTPTTASPCGFSAQLLTSGNISASGIFDYTPFDPNIENYGYTNVPSPDDYSGGSVYAKFYWTHPTTGSYTNYKVVWELKGGSIGNGEALMSPLGTPQYIMDEGGSYNTQYISEFTPAITLGGTPSKGELLSFIVSRDAPNENDTLPVDAYLIGVMLWYPVQ